MRRKSSISTFKFLHIRSAINSLGRKTPRTTTPGLEPDVQNSHGAADQSSQNSMAVILKGLNDTLTRLTKASEKQTATLASLEEDILLRPDSDSEANEDNSNTSNTQLNVSAMLNIVLDPSDSGMAKKSVCFDSEKQNDVLESLTQAFVGCQSN